MCALHDRQFAWVDWLEFDVPVTLASSAIESDWFVAFGAFRKDCDESDTD
jgi:hypothetical protein